MSQYINVRKLFKGGNFMRKYGIQNATRPNWWGTKDIKKIAGLWKRTLHQKIFVMYHFFNYVSCSPHIFTNNKNFGLFSSEETFHCRGVLLTYFMDSPKVFTVSNKKQSNLPVLQTRLNIEALGWKVHGRLEELKPWERVLHYHDLTENLWRIVQYYQSNNPFHNHHHDPQEPHWHSKSNCNTLNFQPIHTNAPNLLEQQFHDIHLDIFQHKTFHSWYFRELLMQMLT